MSKKDSGIVVKLNSDAVRRLLQSNEVMQCLLKEAPKIGEVDSSFVGFDRCHVVVKEK